MKGRRNASRLLSMGLMNEVVRREEFFGWVVFGLGV